LRITVANASRNAHKAMTSQERKAYFVELLKDLP